MKRIVLLSLALILGTVVSWAQDAKSILARMDAAMNFKEGLMVITIEDRKADGSGRTLKANVRYALDSGTLVEFIMPEREKGKRILMIGDSMWMATPSISKPVRLSGKDSFMGTSFTNDDVMNFDKSDDYEGTIASADGDRWVLELTARKKTLPYPRMMITIGTSYLPIEMRMFALSGIEAKRIEFSGVRTFDGKPRPSIMVVTDSMTSGNKTIVTFQTIAPGTVDRSRLSPSGFMK